MLFGPGRNDWFTPSAVHMPLYLLLNACIDPPSHAWQRKKINAQTFMQPAHAIYAHTNCMLEQKHVLVRYIYYMNGKGYILLIAISLFLSLSTIAAGAGCVCVWVCECGQFAFNMLFFWRAFSVASIGKLIIVWDSWPNYVHVRVITFWERRNYLVTNGEQAATI